MTTPRHVVNFSAGPGKIPRPALERVQNDLLDFQGSGMGVAEISHRSAIWDERLAAVEAVVRRAASVPDDYAVLFIQGGASMQFAMVPLNLIPEGGTGDYIVTGRWASLAQKEVAKVDRTGHIAATSEATVFDHLPRELNLHPDSAYLHYTSNNTIYGTEYFYTPDPQGRLLVCDVSSNILSRAIDIKAHDLLYAGAQKNMGPSGVAVVMVRRELLDRVKRHRMVPTLLRYASYAEEQSMPNTPPVLAIHILGCVVEWALDMGGVEVMEQRAVARANLLYGAIDSIDLYRGHVRNPEDRSRMNVTFRLTDTSLEPRFIDEATDAGFQFIAGHRTAGGVRISLYNAMELADVEYFVDFMKEFARRA